MATYTLRGRITEDRHLEVEVPPDAPVGEAEVVLRVEPPPRGSGAAVLALLEKWKDGPITWTPRTREEVDAELNEMRNEWDND